MVSSIQGVAHSQGLPLQSQQTVPSNGASGGEFGALLQQEFARAQEGSIEFSKHALHRVEERGIEVTDDLLGRLSTSVEKAQAKGATNILALDSSLAFIINVPNHRVITTMSTDEMRENVFTNIDAAVIL